MKKYIFFTAIVGMFIIYGCDKMDLMLFPEMENIIDFHFSDSVSVADSSLLKKTDIDSIINELNLPDNGKIEKITLKEMSVCLHPRSDNMCTEAYVDLTCSSYTNNTSDTLAKQMTFTCLDLVFYKEYSLTGILKSQTVTDINKFIADAINNELPAGYLGIPFKMTATGTPAGKLLAVDAQLKFVFNVVYTQTGS